MNDIQRSAEISSVSSDQAMGPGMTPGDAWDAFVTAQQAADEAVSECGGSPGDGTPEGGRAARLLDAADLAWSEFEATALAEPEAGA